jgi:repressor LexA
MQIRTRRQKEVFDYIVRYIEGHGYEPSYQMIARHLGVSSKAGIAKHVKALEEQGLLTRKRDNGSFRLEIGRRNGHSLLEPVIEWIPNEDPDQEPEEWESEPFTLPPFMMGGHHATELAAFRVPDGGMSEKNICEGDVVLLEKRSHCRDGNCVAALINKNQMLLRYFYRDGSHVELRPANDRFDPIRIAGDKIEIKGVFKALLRPA